MTRFYTFIGSILLCIATSTTTAAQDSTITLSKFEEFSTAKGRLLKIELVSIGGMGTLNSEYLSATDLNTRETRTAVRFRYGWRPTSGLIEKDWVYIDREDLPVLLTALDTIKKELAVASLPTQQSFSIVTSNDIRISLRYDEGILSSGWAIYISQLFKHLRSEIPWKTFRINTRYLEALQEIVTKSLAM